MPGKKRESARERFRKDYRALRIQDAALAAQAAQDDTGPDWSDADWEDIFRAERPHRLAYLREQQGKRKQAIARGFVYCTECSGYVPNRLHYPGNDPENGPAHRPRGLHRLGERR